VYQVQSCFQSLLCIKSSNPFQESAQNLGVVVDEDDVHTQISAQISKHSKDTERERERERERGTHTHTHTWREREREGGELSDIVTDGFAP
jgi:hypothetical protein